MSFLQLPIELHNHIANYLCYNAADQPPARPFDWWPRNLQDEASAILGANDALIAAALSCRARQEAYLSKINKDMRISRYQFCTCGLHKLDYERPTAVKFSEIPFDDDQEATDGGPASGKNPSASAAIRKYFTPLKLMTLQPDAAPEARVKKLMSWPTALEQLYYHIDQGEWDGSSDYHGASPWNPDWFHAAGLERALRPQAHSLVRLTITRRLGVVRGLYRGSWLDLSAFRQLQTLECFYELVKEGDLSEILPKSLRRLALDNDEPNSDDALLEQLEFQRSNFRLLAQGKDEHLPNLQEVELLSAELNRRDPSELEELCARAESVLEEYRVVFAAVHVDFKADLGHNPFDRSKFKRTPCSVSPCSSISSEEYD